MCGLPVRWVHIDTGEWVPCDREPVLFLPGKGKMWLVKRGELLFDCRIYRPGDSGKPVYGLDPHVFTCSRMRRTP